MAGNNTTVQTCTVSKNKYAIYASAGTGHLVNQCTITGSTTGIYFAGSSTGEVRNFGIYDCVTSHIASLSTTTLTIRGCHVYRTAPAALSWGIFCEGTATITDCLVHNFYEDGIIVNGNADVSYCTMIDCAHAGFWTAPLTGKTITVHHCTVYVTHDITVGATPFIYGMVVDPSAGGVTDDVVNFYNCTIAYLSRSSLSTPTAFYIQNNGTVRIKNCIVTGCYYGLRINSAVYTPTMDNDYNCFYDNTDDYQGTGAAAGAHDVSGDPLLGNATAYGEQFHLLQGSPCIDTGVALTGINEGFRGGAPDIGAFEYEKPVTRRRDWFAFFCGWVFALMGRAYESPDRWGSEQLMFKKNTAVTGFGIGNFINATTGATVTTGTPTCKRTLDGTAGACANAAAYDATGLTWKIDLAAGDLNGDIVALSFTLTDCLPINYTIRTSTSLVSDVATTLGTPANIDSGGATIADNLKKIADDNGGASFDATVSSLNKLSTAVVTGVAATLQATGEHARRPARSSVAPTPRPT